MNPRPSRTDLPAVALPGEQKVLEAAQRSLAERRGGLRGLWPFLGPAFIAAIAYIDPGNFATNIAAGAKYGYLLLWVILVSNLMAMLIQTMSAKLGIATGNNLAEVSRARFSNRTRIFLWLQAEAVAMATDLAEFIGAALGFHLLFGIPLLPAGVLTGVVAFAILAAELRGVRHLEAVDHGARRRHRGRLRLPDVPREPRRQRRASRASSRRASTAPRASCWPPASSAPRSCRTSSTCTRR